jgi:hypothetical protein
MDPIELLKSVSPEWRPAILIIAMLMPIWYIAIYLYHRDFYVKSKEVLKWAFCFCLSLIWFAPCAIFSLFKTSVDYNKQHGLSKDAGIPLLNSIVDDYYFLAGWISIFVLVFIIASAYFYTNRKRTRSFPITVATWEAALIVMFIILILLFYNK